MYEVNRSLFLLIPREPFGHWLHSIGTDLSDFTLEDLQDVANAYLTDPCDNTDEIWDSIEGRVEEIFAAELADWCEDDSLWPDLHPDIFAEWFDIRTATVVTDLTAEPLAREAFQPLDLDCK